MTPDPLARRGLRFRQHGIGVELVVAHGVFSAAAVDPGTRLLLRRLADDGAPGGAPRVLDVGCGYGPLGLWLAAAGARQVVAVDRDAVAVACTEAGAVANGVADRVTAAASLGYDDVARGAPFDLVVSNVPAKVGPAALRHLLLDAWFHVGDTGRMAVVVVDRLAPAATAALDDPAVRGLERRPSRGYTVLTWRFAGRPAGAEEGSGFERGVYRRTEDAFAAGGLRWRAATSHTIGEFDTLGHHTVALAHLLGRARPAGPVAVVGVGQGHGALAVRAACGPATPLRLVDRDLLALRTAAANLGGDGVEVRHTGRPAEAVGGCGSIVVTLPEKEPVSVTAGLLAPAVAALPPGSPVVLHGRSVDVSRVLDVLGRLGRRPATEARVREGTHAAALVRTGAP